MINADENLLSLSEFTKKRELKAFSEVLAEAAPKPIKYMEHAELITNLGDGNSFKPGFDLTL